MPRSYNENLRFWAICVVLALACTNYPLRGPQVWQICRLCFIPCYKVVQTMYTRKQKVLDPVKTCLSCIVPTIRGKRCRTSSVCRVHCAYYTWQTLPYLECLPSALCLLYVANAAVPRVFAECIVPTIRGKRCRTSSVCSI